MKAGLLCLVVLSRRSWVLCFGGKSVPVNVSGTPKQVKSFNTALGSEARYLKAMKRHGLQDPKVLSDKTKLDRAVRNFERETGIAWPFK